MPDEITQTTAKAPVKILIIDDDPYILPLLQDALFDQEEIVVTTTSDSLEAIAMLRSKNFDVVITDLNMPNADGLIVISTIRENNPDTLVVIITGFATLDSAIEGIRMGVFDYLPKPFSAHEFRFVVKRCVKQIRLRQENCQLREELAAIKKELGFLRGENKKPASN